MIFPQCQMFISPYHSPMILRHSIAQTIYRNYHCQTNFMIFRPRRKTGVCPSIYICGAEIQEVDHVIFGGMMIDNKQNWMEHIK